MNYPEPIDGLILPLSRDPLVCAIDTFRAAQAAYKAERDLVQASWDRGMIRKADKLQHLETVRANAAVKVALIVCERGEA